MSIARLGEFGLIKHLCQYLTSDSSVIVGPGDDCAVLRLNRTYYQLFTCDMIVEGVDFTPQDKPTLVGRKALAVALSDIAACAGIPRHAVVSLGLAKHTPLKTVDMIRQGMFALARTFGVNIVGGDISQTPKLTIDVSMLGVVKKKNLVLRSGARVGDLIFVSGPLGDSILGRHLTFTPRVREAQDLVKNFKINAMIDISDGLVQDLGHILEASRTGAVIYENLIPKFKPTTRLEDALYAGEDFELIFTLSIPQARRLLSARFSGSHLIGHIVEQKRGFKLIDKQSQARTLTPKGFCHF